MLSTNFKQLLELDRQKRQSNQWSGNFLDYLDLLKENPKIASLAHHKLYEMIESFGSKTVTPDDNIKFKRIFGFDVIKIYNFFESEFFGMEKTLMELVRYFKSAAMKGEESRQVLYLVGPVGSGKSSLIEWLKHKLEELPQIYRLDGCPMNEEPLHLVPKNLRQAFMQEFGITIEGDLCPICRYRLENEFDNEYTKFPISTCQYSINSRVGVGVVPPVDPNNQDTSILTGSVDISKLDQYPEDDPRVLSLNGAFNRGNRGIVEFIEVFKNEIEYLHTMITATQEKVIPAPGKHAMIYFDGVIVAHSNEAEWNKFKSEHTNEAILDRIYKIEVRYNLRLSEEVKIYEKILNRSNFKIHIAPHTIEVASMFAILTRLKESNKCDLNTKLRLYNGEEVIERGRTKIVDVDELREEARDEGTKGISTRFIMKSLDDAMSECENNSITPIDIMETMINRVEKLDIAEDIRKKYIGYLRDNIRKVYLEILEKEITKAFIFSYKEQANTLFNNYIDHVEAYVNKRLLKDRQTGEEMQPDESFMKSIEEQIGITNGSENGFRQDVMSFLFSIQRKGGSLDYTCYEPLKEAIEKKLMASVRELSRIVTKAKTRDEDQQEKYNEMVKEMIKLGYNKYSCEKVLKFAANNLWKD